MPGIPKIGVIVRGTLRMKRANCVGGSDFQLTAVKSALKKPCSTPDQKVRGMTRIWRPL